MKTCNVNIWVGAQDFEHYISKQQRLRQVCAYAQTGQSLGYLHTQSMDVDEGLDKIIDF